MAIQEFLENVHIHSDVAGTSGLRFTNGFNSASTAIANPGTGILSVNANGDVIYVDGVQGLDLYTLAWVGGWSFSIEGWDVVTLDGGDLLDVVVTNPSANNFTATIDWDTAALNDGEILVYDGTNMVPVAIPTGATANGSMLTFNTTTGLPEWNANPAQITFNVTDGTTTEAIDDSNTITFAWWALFLPTVSATDTVTYGFNFTGAVAWQAPTYNGTTAVWGNPAPRKYVETFTPGANAPETITHSFNDPDVIVQVKKTATGAVANVVIDTFTNNTVNITSTTTDELEVVIIG